MKVAIIGPICQDEIIIAGNKSYHLGGLAYYTAEALCSLGADVNVFANYGKELQPQINAGMRSRVIPLYTVTTTFVNEYPTVAQTSRIQRVRHESNPMPEDILQHDFSGYDYVVLGPLFHDNLSLQQVRALHQQNKNIVLAGQGLIRYSDDEKIVWKNPENVLCAVKHLQYLFVDDIELDFISKDAGPQQLFMRGLRNLVLTMNERGSVVFVDGKRHTIPAFMPRQLIDSTGAGDTYLAGFLAGTAKFQDVDAIARFAAMAASIGLEKKGAFDAGAEEVVRRLKQQECVSACAASAYLFNR